MRQIALGVKSFQGDDAKGNVSPSRSFRDLRVARGNPCRFCRTPPADRPRDLSQRRKRMKRSRFAVKLSGSGRRARYAGTIVHLAQLPWNRCFPGVARIIAEHQLTGRVNVEADIAAASAISAKCLWVASDKPSPSALPRARKLKSVRATRTVKHHNSKQTN